MVSKKCTLCKNIYFIRKDRSRTSIHCGNECRLKNNKIKEVEKNCISCNKKYLTIPSRKTTSSYCSNKCKWSKPIRKKTSDRNCLFSECKKVLPRTKNLCSSSCLHKYIKEVDKEYLEPTRIDFENFIQKKDNNTCWLWTGSTNHLGYGKFSFEWKYISAHRLSYILYVGEIPEKIQVQHLCNIRNCVNPLHLKLGNQTDNMKYRSESGRWKGTIGINHHDAVLNDEKVKLIKHDLLLNKYSENELAKKYNCSRGAICGIKRNKNWKHVII